MVGAAIILRLVIGFHYKPTALGTGAGDRGRTGTGRSPRDFKSRASAYSATPAYSDCAKHNHFVVCLHYNTKLSTCQEVFAIVYILFTNSLKSS